MQRQIIGAKAACLLIASLAGISAQAGTISITYRVDSSQFTAPPALDGNLLTLDALSTGSFFAGIPGLNALWNPISIRDHSVVDLTTGLLNGTFGITFADGDMLTGILNEEVSALVATGMGPFTQTFTFTGGTGMFTGATGSISGRGLVTEVGTTSSGSGTVTAPGISSVPEPASVALMFGGLLAIVTSRRFFYERRQQCNGK